MHVHRLMVISVIQLGISCAGRDGGDTGRDWQAVVDTVGDTITVRTVSGSVWGDTAVLTPEVTIGVLDGPDEYIFGSIRALAVAGDGSIYVSDGQVPAVRQYAPDGIHVRTLGREGAGPGEHRRLDGGLAVLSDGRVVVRDPGNGRFNVFGPDGASLDSWRHPSGGGFSTGAKLFREFNDELFTTVITNLGVDVTQWKRGLARIAPDGTLLDTVPIPTWNVDRPVVSASSESSSSSTAVPFSPDIAWSRSPHGYFVGGVSTDYRIDLLREPASVLRLERSWTPVPVHPDEAAELREQIVENYRRRFEGWRWNGDPIPETKPPYRSIHVGENGWIWVLTHQPGQPVITEADARAEEERTGQTPLRYREATAFDVFTPEGEYLGHVQTPETFQMYPAPIFDGENVWAVVRDELDVTRVARFRITLPTT